MSIRIIYVWQLEDRPYYYDTIHYDTAAQHILSDQTFGPSLHYYGKYDKYALEAPFPIYLSLIYLLFGRHYLAVRLMNVVLSMIYLFILFRIAARFSKRTALLTALAGCVSPFFIYISGLLYVTQLFALFLILTLYFFLIYSDTNRLLHLVWGALFYALTIATRPVLLPSIPLLLLWIFFAHKNNYAVKVSRTALLLTITLIILTPWTVRNYLVFGTATPGRACLAEANIFNAVKTSIERKESLKKNTFPHKSFTVKIEQKDSIHSWEFLLNDSSIIILEPYKSIQNTNTPYLGLLVYGDSAFVLENLEAWNNSELIFNLQSAEPAKLSKYTHLDKNQLTTHASGSYWQPAAIFNLKSPPTKLRITYPDDIHPRDVRRIALWINLKDSVFTSDGVMLWMHPWLEADAWFVKKGIPEKSINVKHIYPQTSSMVLFRLFKKYPLKFIKDHFLKELGMFWSPTVYRIENQQNIPVQSYQLLSMLFMIPLYILAPVGIYRLRHRLKILFLFLIPVATISFSYALFHAEVRYRIPIDGFIIILAVLGLDLLIRVFLKTNDQI